MGLEIFEKAFRFSERSGERSCATCLISLGGPPEQDSPALAHSINRAATLIPARPGRVQGVAQQDDPKMQSQGLKHRHQHAAIRAQSSNKERGDVAAPKLLLEIAAIECGEGVPIRKSWLGDDDRIGREAKLGREISAVRKLDAVHRGGASLRCKGAMVFRVPITRDENRKTVLTKRRHMLFQGTKHFITVRHRHASAGQIIVLQVDDYQCIPVAQGAMNRRRHNACGGFEKASHDVNTSLSRCLAGLVCGGSIIQRPKAERDMCAGAFWAPDDFFFVFGCWPGDDKFVSAAYAFVFMSLHGKLIFLRLQWPVRLKEASWAPASPLAAF